MAINFRNVSFKYSQKASHKTLNNINLLIEEKNEFIAIVGRTGSGKTTLVQHMNALLLPTEGTLEICGKVINKSKNLKLKDIRQKVGLVFQFPEYQLFEETCIKDVMFGPKNFGKTKDEANIEAVKACKLIGLDPSLYERSPFSLSGGQMRRVALAGVLASNPDILVLDEPTVGLDPKGKIDLMELLKNIQAKTAKSVIMITHDMDMVARYAKRVIVMAEGKIVYDGGVQNLFNDVNKLKDYNLGLPIISQAAIKLKEKGLINFNDIPLTKESLLSIIKNGDYHE